MLDLFGGLKAARLGCVSKGKGGGTGEGDGEGVGVAEVLVVSGVSGGGDDIASHCYLKIMVK